MNITASAILLTAVGFSLLIYVGLSYEEEETALLTWLERTWKGMRSHEQKLGARLNEFVLLAATSTQRLLGFIYGDRVYSCQTAARAICLVNGFTLIGLSILNNPYAIAPHILFLSGQACIAVTFVRWKVFIALITISSTYYALYGLVFHISSYLQFPVTPTIKIAATILLSAYLVEIMGLFAIVASLRKIDSNKRLFLNTFWIAVAAVAVPAILKVNILAFPFITDFGIDDTQVLFQILVALNVVAFITSMVLITVVLISIIIRLAGFLIPRVIYSTVKLKVVQNRKALVGLGVFLVSAGLIGIPPKLIDVIDLIRGFL